MQLIIFLATYLAQLFHEIMHKCLVATNTRMNFFLWMHEFV